MKGCPWVEHLAKKGVGGEFFQVFLYLPSNEHLVSLLNDRHFNTLLKLDTKVLNKHYNGAASLEHDTLNGNMPWHQSDVASQYVHISYIHLPKAAL